MHLVSDDMVREQIEVSLEAARQLIPELSDQGLNLETVDAFCQVLITERRESILETIREELSSELSIAYFGAIVAGILSLVILDKSASPVLPPDWISLDCRPDPNLVVGHMLANVTNYTLAITHLVEVGLESPARTNLRNLLELSWLFLVILAKREKMIAYTKGADNETERRLYFKYFAPKKLRRGLIEIETNSGLPDDVIKALSDTRSGLYDMYSRTVHSAYSDLVIGALGFSFEDEDRLNFGLFGIADKASYPTLYHLNGALFYFLSMFRRLLEAHGLKPPFTLMWQKALALHESFTFVIRNRSKKEGF